MAEPLRPYPTPPKQAILLKDFNPNKLTIDRPTNKRSATVRYDGMASPAFQLGNVAHRLAAPFGFSRWDPKEHKYKRVGSAEDTEWVRNDAAVRDRALTLGGPPMGKLIFEIGLDGYNDPNTESYRVYQWITAVVQTVRNAMKRGELVNQPVEDDRQADLLMTTPFKPGDGRYPPKLRTKIRYTLNPATNKLSFGDCKFIEGDTDVVVPDPCAYMARGGEGMVVVVIDNISFIQDRAHVTLSTIMAKMWKPTPRCDRIAFGDDEPAKTVPETFGQEPMDGGGGAVAPENVEAFA